MEFNTKISDMSDNYRRDESDDGRRLCSCIQKTTLTKGTQTPPLLYMAGTAEKGNFGRTILADDCNHLDLQGVESSYPEVSPVMYSTDWYQTGRELRQIADDLRSSATNSGASSEQGPPPSQFPFLQLMYTMLAPTSLPTP